MTIRRLQESGRTSDDQEASSNDDNNNNAYQMEDETGNTVTRRLSLVEKFQLMFLVRTNSRSLMQCLALIRR